MPLVAACLTLRVAPVLAWRVNSHEMQVTAVNEEGKSLSLMIHADCCKDTVLVVGSVHRPRFSPAAVCLPVQREVPCGRLEGV